MKNKKKINLNLFFVAQWYKKKIIEIWRSKPFQVKISKILLFSQAHLYFIILYIILLFILLFIYKFIYFFI